MKLDENKIWLAIYRKKNKEAKKKITTGNQDYVRNLLGGFA